MSHTNKSEKNKKLISPISKASSHFEVHDYPLIARVINRHLVISSPDFQFPIPVVLPFDPPSIETAGKGLIAAWLQVANYLKEVKTRNETAPAPKKVKDLFPKLADQVPIAEACRILGMKVDMVRDLADSGIIPYFRTPKGHRRFSREKLQNFVKENKANFSD